MAVEVVDDALQAADAHREGGDAEIRLGLSAARGKPKEVSERLGGTRAIGVLGVGERWDRQQQERELKWPPRPVLPHVDVGEGQLFTTTAPERVDPSHALARHRTVREAEGLECLRVGEQHLEACPQAFEGGHAAAQRFVRRSVVARDFGANPRALVVDPRGIVLDERLQRLFEFRLLEVGEREHVEPASLDHLLHGGTVAGTETRRLGDRHLVPRDHLGAHERGACRIVRGRLGVDRYAVAHRELHAAPVDEP